VVSGRKQVTSEDAAIGQNYAEISSHFGLKFNMSVLEKILEAKKERLSSIRYTTPLGALKSLIRDSDKPRDFQTAIRRDSSAIKVIAEIKKASPLKGLIRGDFDHRKIASTYESLHVNAVSVITEEDFFQGRLEFLEEVKKIVSCPVLRKDFIFDEYQIFEARANKADAILLMASVLELRQAEEYLHLARELGLSVLFEVHDLTELEIALRVNAPVVGINNRNLRTLAIDLKTTFELKKEIPGDRTVVSESGIKTREDVLRLDEAGIDAMLIGTSLMESQDIAGKMDILRGTG
jgi:indole-3-glycerol phosphate synthase